jgi:hypothetical protein
MVSSSALPRTFLLISTASAFALCAVANDFAFARSAFAFSSAALPLTTGAAASLFVLIVFEEGGGRSTSYVLK